MFGKVSIDLLNDNYFTLKVSDSVGMEIIRLIMDQYWET
jgi:hypothetical protein